MPTGVVRRAFLHTPLSVRQSFVCGCDGLSVYLWLQLGTCATRFSYARDFDVFCILKPNAVVVQEDEMLVLLRWVYRWLLLASVLRSPVASATRSGDLFVWRFLALWRWWCPQ